VNEFSNLMTTVENQQLSFWQNDQTLKNGAKVVARINSAWTDFKIGI